jgi:hypothetical protein
MSSTMRPAACLLMSSWAASAVSDVSLVERAGSAGDLAARRVRSI